jgi:hypothetical protein
MPAGKIESYSSPAGQAIDEHDEPARQIGELVELSFAGRHPRRFCFHRCLASSPLRARTRLLASARGAQSAIHPRLRPFPPLCAGRMAAGRWTGRKVATVATIGMLMRATSITIRMLLLMMIIMLLMMMATSGR